MDTEALIHFLGGALGGTAGTAFTCPLEVIKTRLQSSACDIDSRTKGTPFTSSPGAASTTRSSGAGHVGSSSSGQKPASPASTLFRRPAILDRHRPALLMPVRQPSSKVCTCFLSSMPLARPISTTPPQMFARRSRVFNLVVDMVRNEGGISALYKGLLPNLVGVTPSKAIYFWTYSTSKRFWNSSGVLIPNSAMVHMISAGSAGFVTATVINPVWLVKTRLQLHHGPLTVPACIKRIYKREGIRGFYKITNRYTPMLFKGVTASYMGISETIIQFVLYEHFRSMVDAAHKSEAGTSEKSKFLNFMVAGGMAKFLACLIAYPHEVVRTRLREEDSKAKGFFSTLFRLFAQGRFRGLYRGLSVQLMRSVPNTAITMGTYELVVHVLHSYLKPH